MKNNIIIGPWLVDRPRMARVAAIEAATVDAVEAAYRGINPLSIEGVPGHFDAKRVLEVAAVGGHQVAFEGTDRLASVALILAFSSIGGNWSRSDGARPACLVCRVDRLSEADLANPAPEEPATLILARVLKAREFLASVLHTSEEAAELAAIANTRGGYATEATLAVARTLAAMDSMTTISRLHVAEAISYMPKPEVK